VAITQQGPLAVISLDDGKANAIGPQLLATLGQDLDAFDESPARALVLTGRSGFFSAGLDLITLAPFDRDAMDAFMRLFEQVMKRVFALDRPVVAAVGGHAIAGGCVLAMQADLRVCVDRGVRFGTNETQLGIGLPPSALEPMRLAIPTASLVRAAYLGELFEPADALALGLVDELAPPDHWWEAALARAESLAAVPREAFAQTKRALRGPVLASMAADHDAAVEGWLDTWFSDEGRARVAAAVERLSSR